MLAAYPVARVPVAECRAGARCRPTRPTYGRLQVQRQLAQYTPTYVYEFEERTTPQFYSIFRLQWQGEPARSFPFGATHVDDLPYHWEYLGHTLPLQRR